MVTVLAWLPGTTKLALRTQDGKAAYYDAQEGNEIHPMFDQFPQAAVHKYWYEEFPESVQVDETQLKQFAFTLMEKWYANRRTQNVDAAR